MKTEIAKLTPEQIQAELKLLHGEPSDALFDYVNNDCRFYEMINARIGGLLNLLDRAAQNLTRFRQKWNDDPEDETYPLYQLPDDVQIPKDARLATLADLIKYHVENIRR